MCLVPTLVMKQDPSKQPLIMNHKHFIKPLAMGSAVGRMRIRQKERSWTQQCDPTGTSSIPGGPLCGVKLMCLCLTGGWCISGLSRRLELGDGEKRWLKGCVIQPITASNATCGYPLPNSQTSFSNWQANAAYASSFFHRPCHMYKSFRAQTVPDGRASEAALVVVFLENFFFFSACLQLGIWGERRHLIR